MRPVLLVAVLLSLPLAADVIILRDGTRYQGTVADKGDAWEITTKHGPLLVKKSEVERIISDPRETAKEAEALRAEAQRIYEEACGKEDAADRNSTLDAAISLLEKAKGIYTDLRMDFSGGDGAWLDEEIKRTTQAIKLSRDKKVMGDARASETEREYRRRRDAIKPEDADGHYALGEWCEKNRMAGNARAEFEAAAKANPDHAKAREKLGYVFHEGTWITREERDRLLAQKPPTPPPPPPPDPAGTAKPPNLADPKDCVAALKSLDPAVRKAAAEGLTKAPDMGVRPLAALLAVETDDAARQAAVATLVLAKGASVVAAAEEVLRDPAIATRFQMDLLDVCDRSGEKEEVGFAARICLYGTKAEAQERAKGVLLGHKKLATPLVARALGVTMPDMRLRAAKVLEEIRTKDSVRALVAIGCRMGDFDDDTKRVNDECRQALQRIGKPSVPYLIEVLGNANLNKWAASVLYYITNQPIGSNHPEQWRKWWNSNRASDDELPEG